MGLGSGAFLVGMNGFSENASLANCPQIVFDIRDWKPDILKALVERSGEALGAGLA